MKYKVGDKVKVVDAGELYDAYEEFIKENAPQLLNKWESGRYLPDGGNYEVKAIGKHKAALNRELAIIEQNNKVYIVGFKGLKLVKQFTKADLKDNHIVETKSGKKYLWFDYSLKKYLTECLEDVYSSDDFVKVWEFETLVWKREEKPVEILDEAEKKWLNHFIKSTNIKTRVYMQGHLI